MNKEIIKCLAKLRESIADILVRMSFTSQLFKKLTDVRGNSNEIQLTFTDGNGNNTVLCVCAITDDEGRVKLEVVSNQ